MDTQNALYRICLLHRRRKPMPCSVSAMWFVHVHQPICARNPAYANTLATALHQYNLHTVCPLASGSVALPVAGPVAVFVTCNPVAVVTKHAASLAGV